MVRSRSQRVIARRFTNGESTKSPDDLLVEEPLEIHLDDVQVSSTMRTPGHDFELAAGFCLTEGVLDGAPILGIRYCGTGAPVDSDFNVVSVSTGGLAPEPTPRLGSTTSSCGICGADAIGELTERLRVLPAYETWDPAFLLGLPDKVHEHQGLFGLTGASHAAGAFDREGNLLALREDIGRHNAVDKVIGRLLLDDRLPGLDLALFVSGRASFEMVQKAWAAGFSALVAVSGPSSLAVATARRAGLTLVGFARDGDGSIYSPDDVV
jgi:FdhD protein